MAYLIDKDALVAEIERRQDRITKGIFSIPLTGRDRASATLEYEILGKMQEFLDTLEVKEVQEEPVSKDLEEAANDYSIYDAKIEAFKAGAQWQKEKMMAKAVDGLVVCNNFTHGYKDILMEIPSFLNINDKVKVIIIKQK